MIIQSISCTSIQVEGNDLEWAIFPDPIIDGDSVVKYDLTTDTVSMPLWYWILITKYVINVESNIKLITE